MSLFQITSSIKESSKTMISAGFVLIFTVPMVRIMINSGINSNDFFSAVPLSMANGVSSLMGNIYPFFAPTVGGIGAFLAGSNTVSNLMLSQFPSLKLQIYYKFPGALMVAAQSVGAAAGNMVAIHNVVAAITVGLLGKEGIVLRITIIPTFYYLFLAGIIVLFFIYVLNVSDPLISSI